MGARRCFTRLQNGEPVIVRAIVLGVALVCGSGCLVVSMHPVYEEDSIGWDPLLVGQWVDADDNVSVQIERGEWRSYRLHYVHPIETGDLTAYLTAVGDARYLDVMPLRGEDRGSFLVPVHAMLRIRLEENRLEVTPLSYDWFADRLRAGRGVRGLAVAMDQKDNALLVTPTATLRDWLRGQPSDGEMFGAAAVFTRKRGAQMMALDGGTP
jgi:hypothetical protein